MAEQMPSLLLASAQAEARIFRELSQDAEALFQWAKSYGHAISSTGFYWNKGTNKFHVKIWAWDASVWPKSPHVEYLAEGDTALLCMQDATHWLRAREEPWARITPVATVAESSAKSNKDPTNG